MLQNYNKWRILQIFFDTPLAEGGLQLREISRKAHLAPTSVKKYLLELEKEEFISKKKERVHGYPCYLAKRDSEIFKFYKKIDLLSRLQQLGLIMEIKNTCMPSIIILFGSASRGEDTEHSDIDIFIGSSEEKIEKEGYEKKIQRKINFFFENDFNKLSKELKNSLINGVILSGYLKVF